MNLIASQFVYCVFAVLSSVAFWPATNATSQIAKRTTPLSRPALKPQIIEATTGKPASSITPSSSTSDSLAFTEKPASFVRTVPPRNSTSDPLAFTERRASFLPPKNSTTDSFGVLVGTSCEGVTCPAGRHCAVNENNRASCVCDVNCYEDYYKVCGSDNRTYSSYCSLTREACRTNTYLTVSYYGACQNGGSLCYGITCPSNRECVVADGRATCLCTQNCPTYSSPVCGSDNKTYINDCDLRSHSCMNNDEITLASYGNCKKATACDGFPCPTGMKCAVNEGHLPVCVCTEECPDTKNIICGSDGRTYGNECELQREACTSGTEIKVAYEGYCIEGSVCSGYRCPSDRQCNVDEHNQPVCVCIQSCPNVYQMVCGSDGINYYNLCELRRQACITGTNVTVARTGRCIYEEYCYPVRCPAPKTCVVDAKNQTSCVCNYKCDGFFSPVCGSDSKTYDSYCHLYDYNCQTNSNISINYYGVCSEGPNCQGIYCPTGKHCDSQHQPEPKCVCDTVCPKTYSPVCGYNNKTYNNYCELQRDACLTNTSIVIRSNKRCEEGFGCENIYCGYGRTCVVDERNQPRCVCSQYCYPGSYEICGSDGKTYSSECFLTAAGCWTNKSIAVQRYGQCEAVDPCKNVVCSSDRYCKVRPNGRPICVCNEQCSSGGSPVCGSDNKTYSSICELQKQACLSSSSIIWLYYGKCVEASICNQVQCSSDKRCAVDDRKQATCVCIDQCVGCQDPVCGSDGLDYSNECELRKTACLSNTNTTLVYRGRCKQGTGLTCNDVSCPIGRVCRLNERNQATCVCNTDCPYYYYSSQVCGSDGKTYESECHLQRAACTSGRNIKVNAYAPCNNDISSTSTTTSTTSGVGCVGRFCAGTIIPTALATRTSPMPLKTNL